MKILVLSDSHAGLSFMRFCINRVKPQHVIHLGDHYDDAAALAEEYPHIRFHQVPGNCDRYRCDPSFPQTLCYSIGGVKLYMTHGHLHGVKSGLERLLTAARENHAQGVLFGHTHQPLCVQLDEMWVLNPGTCGSFGGSAGVLEVEENAISACYLLQQADMETMQV